MTCLLNLLTALLSVLTWHIIVVASQEDNSTTHLFLLMVPESKLGSLRSRVPRQEEAAGGVAGALEGVAGALGPATNVAQILQGILGADIRPIFAGSIAFIPEGDFREGVAEVLQQTVGPAIHGIIMEFNKNVQMALNATSPRPNKMNSTSPNPNQQHLNQNNVNQFPPGQGPFSNYNNQFPSNGNFHPNQIQSPSPTFQQQSNPGNQLLSQNFQPNNNQFQPNLNQQQSNLNLFQQSAGQFQQPTLSQLQQQQQQLIAALAALNQLSQQAALNNVGSSNVASTNQFVPKPPLPKSARSHRNHI